MPKTITDSFYEKLAVAIEKGDYVVVEELLSLLNNAEFSNVQVELHNSSDFALAIIRAANKGDTKLLKIIGKQNRQALITPASVIGLSSGSISDMCMYGAIKQNHTDVIAYLLEINGYWSIPHRFIRRAAQLAKREVIKTFLAYSSYIGPFSIEEVIEHARGTTIPDPKLREEIVDYNVDGSQLKAEVEELVNLKKQGYSSVEEYKSSSQPIQPGSSASPSSSLSAQGQPHQRKGLASFPSSSSSISSSLSQEPPQNRSANFAERVATSSDARQVAPGQERQPRQSWCMYIMNGLKSQLGLR
jgi:hypothetical protein